jgi:dTDP-4-amino-4,6-dideoxygalactose transaminase
VYDALRGAGIGVQVHYVPIHRHPVYERLGFRRGDYPEAEAAYGELLSLPLHAGLTEAEQDAVVDALRRALGGW